MKDTIIILLIEILYLYELGLPWWVWVLVIFLTIVIGFAVMVAKVKDMETLKLIEELYKARNENKDS